jgi:ArsR family transcriptional regulator, arsenate/arsenite/antimonite-responsive transcriptional repressor
MNSIIKALDDPTRRRIIELLKKKDMTAGEIAEYFNMTKPSISHHLDILKQAAIIVGVKEGQFITYSLNTTVFDELVQWILDVAKGKSKK